MKLPNFDLIARPYRWLEYLTLGKTLERCRFHYLPQLLGRRRALVLGDGDGRFTARLLAQNPAMKADAIDISPAMLALLRGRCAATIPDALSRLETHQTDALSFHFESAAGESYDLVVTHFFLDCLSQSSVEALVEHIASTLAPDALWLISDFRIPSGPMRIPARVYVRSLYFAFRILTGLRITRLPDHAAPLLRAGFTCKAERRLLAGLLSTELWQGPNSHTKSPRIR